MADTTGQRLRNLELSLAKHADQAAVEKVVEEQLIKFLQAQGVDTQPLLQDQNYLKRYLTGDPVWFVSEHVCIRVPLAGINSRSKGFEAPPCEVRTSNWFMFPTLPPPKNNGTGGQWRATNWLLRPTPQQASGTF